MTTSIFAFPAMRWLFLAAGINANTWRSEVMRGLSCAAFGAAEPVLTSRPLGLDAVAVHIRDDLASGGLPLKLASAIVRGFFDRWVEGVAHAEHHGQDVVFVVAEVGDPASVKADRNWRCAVGPFDKLQAFVADLPKPVRRVLYVHLLDVLADIRRCAGEAGLDLSGMRFFVPPDHPSLAEIKAEWATWRGANNVTGRHAKFPRIGRERKADIEGLVQ
jgi:hypothetical protein